MQKGVFAGLIVASLMVAVACSSASPAFPGTFSQTGSMSEVREGQTATLLLDGRVLIAGGTYGCCDEWTHLSSAELYNPATGTFSRTASMTTPRAYHLASLLQDGRVLIADTTSAELYDPSSGRFSPTGSPIGSPEFTTATLLPDGRVLLAGAYGTGDSAPAELYEPKTGAFGLTGSLIDGCVGSSAAPLKDGRVLFVGCGDGSREANKQDVFRDSATAELYNPETGTFSMTGAMTQSCSNPTATALADGSVLVTGCSVTSSDGTEVTLTSAEIYDPATGTFKATGAMAEPRTGYTATLLGSGLVLIAGGWGQDPLPYLSTAELFDPARGTFSQTPTAMLTGRAISTATLLRDGRVLFTGGRALGEDNQDHQLSSAEIYTPMPIVPSGTRG